MYSYLFHEFYILLSFIRYVLTLFNDGMRSVRGFNFDRAASSVITTCVSIKQVITAINFFVVVIVT